MGKPRIEEIKIIHSPDCDTDLSFIGEYTDDMEPGIIVRQYGEFYEKLPAEMERDTDGKFYRKGAPDVPPTGREYRGFRPYAGGEKPGSADYYKYGYQDFKHMEQIERGNLQFIGIYATAKISYSIEQGSRRIETFRSGGLWGIEEGYKGSDKYIREEEKNQLDELREHLEQFNIDLSTFDELAAEALDAEPVYK